MIARIGGSARYVVTWLAILHCSTCASAAFWLNYMQTPNARLISCAYARICEQSPRLLHLTWPDAGDWIPAMGNFFSLARSGRRGRHEHSRALADGFGCRRGAQCAAAPGHRRGAGRQGGRRQCGRGSIFRSLAAVAPAPIAARPGAVRQSLADPDRAGARPRRGGQRIQGRSRHAAQSRRPARRSARGAAARASRLRGGDAAGAHHRRQDGSAAYPSRRGAFGDRARRDAGARNQESAVRHPRRGAAPGAIGQTTTTARSPG